MFTISLHLGPSGAACLALAGHLDDAAARDLLHAAADVVRCGCSSLVVDLDELVSFDAGAAFAVVGCTRLARWLPGGVEVVATRSPGRDLARAAGVGPARAAQATPTPGPDTMAACHAS